jgi:hypothetical protein
MWERGGVDLGRFIGFQEPGQVRPPERRGPVAWALAAVVVVLVAGFLWLNRPDDAPTPGGLGSPGASTTLP